MSGKPRGRGRGNGRGGPRGRGSSRGRGGARGRGASRGKPISRRTGVFRPASHPAGAVVQEMLNELHQIKMVEKKRGNYMDAKKFGSKQEQEAASAIALQFRKEKPITKRGKNSMDYMASQEYKLCQSGATTASQFLMIEGSSNQILDPFNLGQDLAIVASNYNKMRIQHLEMWYEPTSGTATNGAIRAGLLCDPRAVEDSFASPTVDKISQLATTGQLAVWQPGKLFSYTRENNDETWYYTNSLSGEDDRFTQQLIWFCMGLGTFTFAQNPAYTYGKFHVRFHWSFKDVIPQHTINLESATPDEMRAFCSKKMGVPITTCNTIEKWWALRNEKKAVNQLAQLNQYIKDLSKLEQGKREDEAYREQKIALYEKMEMLARQQGKSFLGESKYAPAFQSPFPQVDIASVGGSLVTGGQIAINLNSIGAGTNNALLTVSVPISTGTTPVIVESVTGTLPVSIVSVGTNPCTTTVPISGTVTSSIVGNVTVAPSVGLPLAVSLSSNVMQIASGNAGGYSSGSILSFGTNGSLSTHVRSGNLGGASTANLLSFGTTGAAVTQICSGDDVTALLKVENQSKSLNANLIQYNADLFTTSKRMTIQDSGYTNINGPVSIIGPNGSGINTTVVVNTNGMLSSQVFGAAGTSGTSATTFTAACVSTSGDLQTDTVISDPVTGYKAAVTIGNTGWALTGTQSQAIGVLACGGYVSDQNPARCEGLGVAVMYPTQATYVSNFGGSNGTTYTGKIGVDASTTTLKSIMKSDVKEKENDSKSFVIVKKPEDASQKDKLAAQTPPTSRSGKESKEGKN